jgi:hypothetical protein
MRFLFVYPRHYVGYFPISPPRFDIRRDSKFDHRLHAEVDPKFDHRCYWYQISLKLSFTLSPI